MNGRFWAALGLALTATGALAFDFGDMKTREIDGLEGPTQGQGLSNQVLGNAPLALEGIASLAGRNLRTRFWTIEADGIVPIHDHSNRPAVFSVLSGEIYEYTSAERQPRLYREGGLALEEGGHAHWWLLKGTETVHLIAYDVFVPGRNAVMDVAPVPTADAIDLPDARGAELAYLGSVDFGVHFGDGTGEGWVLSTYKATIDPGGRFPDFTGPGEPVQVFVWQGAVTQHGASGETALGTHQGHSLENGATAWWENTGNGPAVLYFGAVERASEVLGLKAQGMRPDVATQ